VANPSVEEYWHMGEIISRFLNVMSLIVRGENSIDINELFQDFEILVPDINSGREIFEQC
jgi:hypothetical protein